MSLIMQFSLGTTILVACSILHFLAIGVVIKLLKNISSRFTKSHWSMLIAVAFAAITFSHTVQVWIWAVVFIVLKVLPNISDALYFSIVTYTTVGYGDVTLAQDFRIFASMAAMTGVLNFGLSTAFLVGLFARILPQSEDNQTR
jgi:voltage-gated potassium channel Kch